MGATFGTRFRTVLTAAGFETHSQQCAVCQNRVQQAHHHPPTDPSRARNKFRVRVNIQPRKAGTYGIRLAFGMSGTRKVDIKLPGKGNSGSHGARPVHQIILVIKWIRTSELSMKNSLYLYRSDVGGPNAWRRQFLDSQHLSVSCRYNYFTEMCSGSEEGSYIRLRDVCITQLEA